jgi:hypothetical protein
MKNCKTCEHWNRVTPYPNERSYYNSGGYCESPKIGEGIEHEPDSLVYSYMEGGSFWTGPMFGCVHHKILKPSKTS